MNDPAERTRLDAADYARAEQMLAPHRARLIPQAAVAPQWSSDGTRFWYRSGTRHIVVDPAAGTRRDAFDHERLAAALSQGSGHAVEADDLPLASLDFEPPGGGADAIRFSAFDTRWEWSDRASSCTRIDDDHPAGPGEVASPDGAWVAFRRGGDVWVRSRDGRQEFALTEDAEPDWDYGGLPDAATKVSLPLQGLDAPLVAEWSPDSTRLLTHRIDQRGLPEQVLVESSPPGGGRPVAHRIRYPMPDDEAQATVSWRVLDVGTRQVVGEQGDPEVLSVHNLTRRWWTGQRGSAIHVLHQSRDGRTLELRRIDPLTGARTTLVTETDRTRVDPSPYLHLPPVTRVLDSGEILWWSQRDGWGHLYLYSADGGRVERVTEGPWLVHRVLWVDEDRRQVWFVACGLHADDPYVRQICRVGLDGSGFERLTDDDLDHDAVSPAQGGYLLDRASDVATPPRARVLDGDGLTLVELEAPDTAPLRAAGWSPPERFRTLAADGRTPIHGVLWRPHGFDPARRYPVVDHCYPGPNTHRASPAFGNLFTGEPEALAALGFAVVAIDGRGTPLRSKAFLDHSYTGDLGMSAALADHVAAIRELGRRHSWLDTGRVAMTGDSGGGFATARALLTHPEFYTVGVARTGAHDFSVYLPFWTEQFCGEPSAENRRAMVNTHLADNLRGKLLLIDGELDDNVLHYQSLRLVDALIDADADVDMLLVPGVDHSLLGRYHYITRRTWDYLVRHLHGTEPPRYRIAPLPPMPEWALVPS
ncbi:S9 family peptidase [Nocardiopsis dassonvillei]|uniref:S9 family peptidase n=1 Tax=Nocardiopsis dassonvillei TaxID=2014 RepID=UPI0036730A83